ncbi:MAG: flagellar biosynthetic protein FliO [Planctomycetota bacterium]
MLPNLAFPAAQTADLSGLAGAEGPDLTRYFLVCGFLLLLILALALGFRRLSAAGGGRRGSRRALQTLDVLSLGSRQRVAVVRCYDRSYLLGLGDKEVRLLAELDADESEPAEAPDDTALNAVGHTAGGFLDALRSRAGEVLPTPARGRAARTDSQLGKGVLG